MTLAWTILALIGCESAPPPPADETPLDRSWIAEVVRAPARFAAAVETDRGAWIALHGSDLPRAAEGDGPAALRARWELADLHSDLGNLSDLAWQSTAATWEARTGLPQGSALPWFAALAAGEAGDPERAAAWLTRATDAADPSVREAAAWLASGASPPPRDNPLIERWEQHARARETGDVAWLKSEAARPLLLEPGHHGHSRTFYDPQLHRTLAEAIRPELTALPADMAGLLFSPCPTAADLQAERDRLAGGGAPGSLCARSETWTALGLDTRPGDSDDPERARALVRALDRVLDPWSAALTLSASAEGLELLDQLGLVPLFRSRVLLSMARRSLEAEHPRQALALAQLALDLEHPRDLSPVNAPGLFAVLAEANLLTGHTREALDALQVLVEVYPDATGVDEIVGDLAILQAMDRQGDSKEH